jgi:hypothetical protein
VGSRVYICAHTNLVWATNHNAAAVLAGAAVAALAAGVSCHGLA